MSIESVSFLPPSVPSGMAINSGLETGAGLTAGKIPADFAAWFDQQMVEVNSQLNSSEVNLRQLASGENNNIHGVMMSLEKAKLSFQLVLQVRNKALEAYQDMMRMQI